MIVAVAFEEYSGNLVHRSIVSAENLYFGDLTESCFRSCWRPRGTGKGFPVRGRNLT